MQSICNQYVIRASQIRELQAQKPQNKKIKTPKNLKIRK